MTLRPGALVAAAVAAAVALASCGSDDPPAPTTTVSPAQVAPTGPTGAAALAPTTTAVAPTPPPRAPSRAVGKPFDGRLVRGVQLPSSGPDHVTWDPVLKQSPNRWTRIWGTDRLVDRVLTVAAQYRQAHPDAPRLVIGDLSRPHGGDFGPQYGGLGHGSHQNGLDADVYYPRKDGLERAPRSVAQIDRALAQELVLRFVAAGAQYVFVGPHTGLRGPAHPRRVVQELIYHDDHLHFRLRAAPNGQNRR